jgi:hypothetical protein
LENKIKDIKSLKCYILEFQCKKAIPARHIVVAYNAHDAINIFIKHWKEGFKAGEFDIPVDELQDIRVEEWCSYWTGMLGRF